MKYLKIIIMVTVFVWAIGQKNGDVQAFYNVSAATNAEAFYPLPHIKPSQKCVKDNHYEHMDKKQAAAAALGLYLGLKNATVPQGFKIVNAKSLNCAG